MAKSKSKNIFSAAENAKFDASEKSHIETVAAAMRAMGKTEAEIAKILGAKAGV
jgi:antitoxin component HigA of HigAB toxin-antitoxin module